MSKRSRRSGAGPSAEAARRAAERQSRDQAPRPVAASPVEAGDVAARLTRGNNRWDALDHLKREQALYVSVTARRDRSIRAARAAGATWTDIARLLGVSPQAVQQRYGKHS